MDTRFWGPSGWQLYHLVAYSYDGRHREKYKAFFEAMKTTLPCRFCRESTTKFIEGTIIPLENKAVLSRWMYDLHNMVNQKLRSQCKDDPRVICPPDDPTFEEVTSHYEGLLCGKPRAPPGLDFLFCVAYNFKQNPTLETFELLPYVYPYPELRSIIRAYKKPTLDFKWMYGLAKKLCAATDFPLNTYRGTLQIYGRVASSCNRGKTCRNGKRVRDHRKTYKITHSRLV